MSRYRGGLAQALSIVCFLVLLAIAPRIVKAQNEDRQTRLARVEKTFGDPPNAKRLAAKDRIWVDTKKHLVVVDGYIAIREGQLEMLACPAGTKEHESVVGLFSKAQFVHAALLAAGAQAGKPVQWEPKFEPPTGSEIEIHALWFDSAGKKQLIDVRKWVKQFGKSESTLDVNWVFAGSSMWKDPDSGEERYMAESGDLVCLSNFSTATLDVPIKSSQANSGLLFMANTEQIPPEGTPVRLVFRVVKPTTTEPGEKKPTAQQPTSPKPTVPKPSGPKPTGPKPTGPGNADKESLDLLTPK